jgi:hypothetical protein
LEAIMKLSMPKPVIIALAFLAGMAIAAFTG